MNGLKHITKIRQYCDYVEGHLRNIERAWEIVKDKCGDMHPIYDDHLFFFMDGEIKNHDVSKMSPEEFIPYQQQFAPVGDKPLKDNPVFLKAWEHHKEHNPHHWENWTQRVESFPNENACHCVVMVCDWMAMGFAFGDTAESYYERNKEKILLPDWSVKLIMDMFLKIKEIN
jgi:hypothetical protein